MFQYTQIDNKTNSSIFCAYVLCFYYIIDRLLYFCCWKGSPEHGECLMKPGGFCCIRRGREPAAVAIPAFPSLEHLRTGLTALSPVGGITVLQTRAELCGWHRNRCLILILRSEGFQTCQASPCLLRLPSHKRDLKRVVGTACL